MNVGIFPVFGIMNKAAMNMYFGKHIQSFLFDIYLRV